MSPSWQNSGLEPNFGDYTCEVSLVQVTPQVMSMVKYNHIRGPGRSLTRKQYRNMLSGSRGKLTHFNIIQVGVAAPREEPRIMVRLYRGDRYNPVYFHAYLTNGPTWWAIKYEGEYTKLERLPAKPPRMDVIEPAIKAFMGVA